MMDAAIKSAKALRRLYSMRLAGTPLAHETQGDGRARRPQAGSCPIPSAASTRTTTA